MVLPALKIENTSLSDFIKFWGNLYIYNDEGVYNECINKTAFTSSDIQILFEWKNGMELSTLKQESLNNKIISRIDYINHLKNTSSWNIDDFCSDFKNVSFVWRIFLLHLIKPDEMPIYDQNVHRAYNYIHGMDYKMISEAIKESVKNSFYFEQYVPFIKTITDSSIRQVDKALFAFGQFIKTTTYNRIFE